MLYSIYEKILNLARHKYAEKTLIAVSFIGSTIFPIPPDMFLAPMVLARPQKWWWLALICTLASVLGAIVGYMIGLLAFEILAKPIIEFYTLQNNFDILQNWYSTHGWLALLFASITPFPYKLVTIFSGIVQFNLFLFIAISLFGRSVRFFLVAFLLYKFGKNIEQFIQKKLAIILTIICIIIFMLYIIVL